MLFQISRVDFPIEIFDQPHPLIEDRPAAFLQQPPIQLPPITREIPPRFRIVRIEIIRQCSRF
jgi:hypothetical protein